MKKKLLIFHQAIAPYRIDFFNNLNEHFNTQTYLYYAGYKSQAFDTERINSRLTFLFKILKGTDFFGRSIRFQVFTLIKKTKPDIVITNEFSINTLLMILCKSIFHLPCRTLTICDDSITMAEKSKLLRKATRFIIMKHIDGVILCNSGASEWYKIHFPSTRTFTFPIIQEDNYFRKQLESSIELSKKHIEKYNLNGKKVLLFVGRLVPVKNLPYLIEEFCSVTDPNTVLVLVGNGPEEEELRNMALKANIEKQVIFPGRFDGTELIAWYNIGSLLVLPSYSEAFGAVTNEALLAGMPALVSEKAGSSCLIDETNGAIFSLNKGCLASLLKEKLSVCQGVEVEKINLRPSLMPYSYAEQMNALINWIR